MTYSRAALAAALLASVAAPAAAEIRVPRLAHVAVGFDAVPAKRTTTRGSCPDDPERLSHLRLWIIDPLDGTREYVEGRSDWAVHVALAVQGKPAAGAVAVPALDRLFRSDRVEARIGSRPRPLMLVSRTRAPAGAEAIAAAIGADMAPMGSAGAKAMNGVRRAPASIRPTGSRNRCVGRSTCTSGLR